jgi:hypothetical protein
MREFLEARLEQWFDNDLHCCLYHTICDDWNAERPLRPISLRDIYPSDWQGPVPLFQKTLSDPAQKHVNANFLLDDLEGLLVDARGTAVGFDLSVRSPKNIISAHLVIQHSKLPLRIRLGCPV